MAENNVSAEQNMTIPYYVHEGEMARLDIVHKDDKERMERTNKRLFISLMVALGMLFASNIAWVLYEMSYETFYVEQRAESDTGDSTALPTTGEGSVNYYGNARKAGDDLPGEEEQQQQPGEAVPDV